MIRINYAKSFEGFKTRIVSKITEMTVIQLINKFHFNRNINNLKINMCYLSDRNIVYNKLSCLL